jgi:hypothetical protein
MTLPALLTASDEAFVRRRLQLQRWWPWAALGLALAVVGLWGGLLVQGSLLVNPWIVIARLEAGQLAPGTLAALALLGSVGFFVLGIVMLAVLALLHAAMRNERRLLEIIRRLR